MEKKYLAINLGSTSKRYSLFFEGESIFELFMQKKGKEYFVSAKYENVEDEIKIPESEFKNSVKFIKDSLIEFKIIEKINEISAVGIRVVASGEYFLKNKIIDSNYQRELEKNVNDAPLHIKPVLSELNQLKRELPSIKIVGISDSTFHYPLPDKSKNYAIPLKDAKKYGIYRQGFHGLSVASSMRYLKNFKSLKDKTIVCHLGGGCSIVAIKNGKTIDTSMGLTPLEGILGSTRSGDIDSGALIHLSRKLGYNLSDMESYLNNKSGLYGITGSEDMRVILSKSKKGDKDAKLAIEIFIYRVQKYIGAYFVAIGGLDCLVFTGAMGKGSQYIRKKICESLGILGVDIDLNKNKELDDKEGFIQSNKSKVKVVLINPREMDEVYIEMKKVLKLN